MIHHPPGYDVKAQMVTYVPSDLKVKGSIPSMLRAERFYDFAHLGSGRKRSGVFKDCNFLRVDPIALRVKWL